MKSKNQYYITYERDSKKGFIAHAPSIPGCVVYGKTLKEAYYNIQSAIRECLEIINDYNKKPPIESITPDRIKRFSFVKI